ncbi:MAG: hypothetical protein NC177_18095 [Ruminococcus flavefaciens]|nr:hypothetical protein [Ruminococcus flavefaciens]
MTQFIKNPNLPQSRVKKLLCGKLDNRLKMFINSFGIDIIEIIPNKKVDSRIANHADISIHHIGGNEILIDESQQNLSEQLKSLGMYVYLTDSVHSDYPNDCSLNFARINERAIGKIDIIDHSLLKLLENYKVKLINAKQGYSKCSVCIINQNALITDDKSIYRTACRFDIDCLLINKGDVRLDGFDYGFIGGASGLIDKNHLIFFGDITKHTDYDKIKAFLDKHSCKASYLKNYPLTDVGGIVPIIEEMLSRNI